MPLALQDTLLDSDLNALLRLQEIVLQAVEGARGPELDHEYKELRSMLLYDTTYKNVIPLFVRRYRDLSSLWPALKSFSPQWEPRRVEVRHQFEDALSVAERFEFSGKLDVIDSSAWTGAASGADQLRAIAALLPIAKNGVQLLIESLEASRSNGGPPLDDHTAAIEALRELHHRLGEMLEAAENGTLGERVNGGLAIEAARYAKRAAKALRSDPMPYAFSATILAIMTACGVPDIGGYLTGVAVSMKKNSLER